MNRVRILVAAYLRVKFLCNFEHTSKLDFGVDGELPARALSPVLKRGSYRHVKREYFYSRSESLKCICYISKGNNLCEAFLLWETGDDI